jgi:hypothetical protein
VLTQDLCQVCTVSHKAAADSVRVPAGEGPRVVGPEPRTPTDVPDRVRQVGEADVRAPGDPGPAPVQGAVDEFADERRVADL